MKKVTKEEQERIEMEREENEARAAGINFDDEPSQSMKDEERKKKRAEEVAKRDAEAKANEPKLPPEQVEFNKLVDQLYQRVVDMQLRPEETKKFAEQCERIKEAYTK